MVRRYRIMIGGGLVALVVAVGGIAVAEQGGQSGDHRQNPTTTTGATTTTVSTLAANTAPKTEKSDTEGTDVQTDSSRLAALCHALHEGNVEHGQTMKALNGQAFQNLECNNVAPLGSSGDEGTNESAGAADNSNAGGNGGGQGQGADNQHALDGQAHKPA
jgi:hypothetical protein